MARSFAARSSGSNACRAGECPEWQRELTVNQPPYGFVGSSPTSPTNYFNNLQQASVAIEERAFVAQFWGMGWGTGIHPLLSASIRRPPLQSVTSERLHRENRALCDLASCGRTIDLLISQFRASRAASASSLRVTDEPKLLCHFERPPT